MDKWKQIIEDRRLKNNNENSIENFHKKLRLNDIKDLKNEIDTKLKLLRKSLSDYDVYIVDAEIKEDTIFGDIFWWIHIGKDRYIRTEFFVSMKYSTDGNEKFFKYHGHKKPYKQSDLFKWECLHADTFEYVTEDFLKTFADEILNG